MEVAMEPPMDLLISKLIPLHQLTRHSLSKVVSLSLKHHRPSSVADTFQV